MNIRDIEIFKEIAMANNLTRASERLGLTQPTLSSWLVKIEDQIGVQLFTRSKKGLSLTEAGSRLLEKSAELNNSWTQLIQYVQNSQDTRKTIFRLGCHESVALYSVPKILHKLLKQHPQIELSLKHDLSRRLTEDIVSDRIDIGIIINPISHPDLVLKPIGTDQVSFWSTTGNSNSSTLICDPELKQSQAMLHQLKTKLKNYKFSQQLSTSSLEVAALVASEGLAIAILPTRVAKKYPQLKRLAEWPSYNDKLALVFKSGFQKNKSARLLIDAIMSAKI